MHKYVKAIGFQNITSEKEWNQILTQLEREFSGYERIAIEDELDFCELKKKIGTGFGICSYGQIEKDEKFNREYYIPYFEGSGITSYADVIIQRRIDREAYFGICEDAKIGVSLIFYLQNEMEYIKEMDAGKKMRSRSAVSVTLSGLAVSGTVLFPVLKNKDQEEKHRETTRNRMMLLSAARQGNSEAIESLTLDDIDLYSQVSRRLEDEDILSIVDTYFMPYGVECDQYSILGEILDIDTVENTVTKEELYVLTLDVNELQFDVCVPVEKTIGQPEIGRRFKADIWLQGYLNFS